MARVADIVSTEQLDKAVASLPAVVVHFWATWCEPCKQMDAVLAQLASENSQAGFFRVEAEALPDLAEKFEVSVVPFFVFFKNGAVVDRIEGANPPELTAKIGLHIKTAAISGSTATALPKPSLTDRIESLLAAHPILLFMKGTPDAPECGFSSKVVAALKSTGLQFDTFNILTDNAIRQGLKELSNWPTYPQLYAKSTLIGGCDIIEELHASNELKSTLEEALNTPEPSKGTSSAPQATPMEVGGESKEELQTRIKGLVEKSPVMLFMKGTPAEPKCGFSRKVSAALQSISVPYETFDILQDEAVRQGLKEYSNWPTYPQLYVKGEMLGGCDIVLELHETGELKSTIQESLGEEK
mmetsp:Transcript_41243/g.78803  ORF Transcript_41243/g.78803 Transcript_41243/m.78803 type:complete len:356 (+) Transcript_41243:90-1157(+)|eukprot:CAMPEP_0114238472 /NCGR_PEP_ID=MMETSP0058-20121206/7942_1 /TAXON_ID=36894 /ORGANISM="Pyramimonas parkeae, CCMP726" /LENGTH=355 /DNA_ID=CAMNT_0001350583 /DNA_START=50 /DNA_END=1117 /DNA_ORIENTATION=+